MTDRGAFTVEVLAPPQVLNDTALRLGWSERAILSTSLYKLYQSPIWFDHLAATIPAASLRVLVVRDARGVVRGVVPVERRRCVIAHQVKGYRVEVFAEDCGDLLGSEPLVDPDPAAYQAVIDAMWDVFPGVSCWRAKSLPVDSPLYSYLATQFPQRDHFVIKDRLPRPFYSIRFDGREGKYEERLTAKQRSDLRRKKRLLSEALGGAVVCRSVRTLDEVQRTYDDLEAVARCAWLSDVKTLPSRASLEDAAARGILRSYVLYASEQPVAFVIGYQALGIYHYSDVAFAVSQSKQSPGTMLLFDIIQDVASDAVEWFNFGIGAAEYKRRFANVITQDVTAFIIRNSLWKRVQMLPVQCLDWARLQSMRLTSERWGDPVAQRAGARKLALFKNLVAHSRSEQGQ